MSRIVFPSLGSPLGAGLLLGFALGVGLAGCASPIEMSPLPERRPLGAELDAYEAPVAPLPHKLAPSHGPYPATAPEPTGVLTLRDSLALALQHNPELTTFSWEVRVREAQTIQAGLFPNPEIEVELENFAGSGDFRAFDSSETTVSLGQLIELAGKRLKRRRVAALERDLAGWDYEVRRLEVFTEVAQAFVAVIAAQERLALAEELLRIADDALASVTKQVNAGATSPVERTRAAVTVEAARIARRQARAELARSRTRLVATWGSSEPTFDRVEGDFYTVQGPPPLDALVSQVAQNPDLARWIQEVELREAVVALEDARRIPNVTAAGGVRRLHESDDTVLVFGMSVPIPVFDRNQGARQAARRDLAKARYQRRAVEVRVATSLGVAHEELQASFEELAALRDRVLPQAQEAYEGVREGYLRGLFRYVDVLDAQRTLFELRGRHIDAIQSYHATVAEIERLTGEPL